MMSPFGTPVLVLLAVLWVACDGANAQKDELTSLNPTLCISSDIFSVSNLSIVYVVHHPHPGDCLTMTDIFPASMRILSYHRWTHTLDYAMTATALRGGMSPRFASISPSSLIPADIFPTSTCCITACQCLCAGVCVWQTGSRSNDLSLRLLRLPIHGQCYADQYATSLPLIYGLN
jgi:hypothetical protein